MRLPGQDTQRRPRDHTLTALEQTAWYAVATPRDYQSAGLPCSCLAAGHAKAGCTRERVSVPHEQRLIDRHLRDGRSLWAAGNPGAESVMLHAAAD